MEKVFLQKKEYLWGINFYDIMERNYAFSAAAHSQHNKCYFSPQKTWENVKQKIVIIIFSFLFDVFSKTVVYYFR